MPEWLDKAIAIAERKAAETEEERQRRLASEQYAATIPPQTEEQTQQQRQQQQLLHEQLGFKPVKDARRPTDLAELSTKDVLNRAIANAEKKLRDAIYTDVTFPEKVAHTGAQFIESAIHVGVAAPAKMHAIVQRWVTNFDDFIPEGMDKDVEEMAMYKLGTDIDRFTRKYLPIDERQMHKLHSKISSGFGSFAGFAGVHALTAGLGGGALAAAAVTGALGASAESVDIFERGKAAGLSDEDALIAAITGIASGAIELIPIARFFKRINRASKGLMASGVANIIRTGAMGSVENALQEWLQTDLGNVALKRMGVTDPKFFEDANEAAGIGGFVGAVVNAVVAIIGGRRHRGRMDARTMAFMDPDATARLLEASEKAVHATGPSGIPSEQQFAEEGLEGLTRKERGQYVKDLRREQIDAQKIRGDTEQAEAADVVARGKDEGVEDLQLVEEAGRPEPAPREEEALAGLSRERRAAAQGLLESAHKQRGEITPGQARDSLGEHFGPQALQDLEAAGLLTSEYGGAVYSVKEPAAAPAEAEEAVGPVPIRSEADFRASPDKQTPLADAQGRPITVYHGTSAQFRKFKKRKLGKSTGAPSAKLGFFFASKRETAEVYLEQDYLQDPDVVSQEHIDNAVSTEKAYRHIPNHEQADIWAEKARRLRAKFGRQKTKPEHAKGRFFGGSGYMRTQNLVMRNPKLVMMAGEAKRPVTYYDAITQAKKEGHDGVIFSNTRDGSGLDTIWVVFSPKQVLPISERAVSVRAGQRSAPAPKKPAPKKPVLKKLPKPQAIARVEKAEAEMTRRTPMKEESGPALSKKAKQARTEAAGALDELAKYMSGRTSANPLLDPELAALLADLAVKSVNAGILTFADFVKNVTAAIGEEATKRIGPALADEWNSLRRLHPEMTEADTVEPMIKVTRRVAPTARAPGITELPEVDEANESTPSDAMDQYFADRDEAVTDAERNAGKLQDAMKDVAGTKHYGKKARLLDQAIFVYIDLKGKAVKQFEKYKHKLSGEQISLYNRSQNLSKAELALAERIREENERFGKQAKDAGVIGSYLENYVARLWESVRETKQRLIARFQTTTARAKPRTLESVLHGWALGKTLRVTTASNAQLLARTEIAQTIAARNLIQLASKAGLLSDKQLEKWKKVEHPNFRKWIWIGKVEEGKVYGREVFIDPDGNVYRRAELYAEPELATRLNRALRSSVLLNIPVVRWGTKWVAILKSVLLQTALFHPQAFVRSSMFGSKSVRFIKSYERGKQAIMNFTQELRDLVRAGLTIGRVQDWDEDLVHERTLIGKAIDKVPMARDVKDKLLELRDRQTNWVFRKVGAYMKVQAALLEYRHLLKKHAKEIESGRRTRHYYAKIAAKIANDDFGGLHLQRLSLGSKRFWGRSPELQHVFRVLALAPDWTESNIRSAVKAFGRGDEASVYRAFWGRIMLRSLGITTVFNLIMAGFDDKEFWERYQRAWKEGNLRWLDVDITPLYRALGGADEKRKYFSIVGHFRDPVKFALHPVRSAKHKGSVLTRIVADIATGTDWSGRPFTSWKELVGIDEKGEYKAGRRKGQPKGGRLTGQLVRATRAGGRTLEYDQMLSWFAYEMRASLPIPMQQGVAFVAGEIDGFDAIAKSLGFMTATTYPSKSPERGIERAVEFKDKSAAQAALRRMGTEAAAGGEAAVQVRRKYIGRLVYGASRVKDPSEKNREILATLDITPQEALASFAVYARSRRLSLKTQTAYRRRIARMMLQLRRKRKAA